MSEKHSQIHIPLQDAAPPLEGEPSGFKVAASVGFYIIAATVMRVLCLRHAWYSS